MVDLFGLTYLCLLFLTHGLCIIEIENGTSLPRARIKLFVVLGDVGNVFEELVGPVEARDLHVVELDLTFLDLRQSLN